MSRWIVAIALGASLLSRPAGAQGPGPHDHGGAPPEKLGSVHLETSCAPAVQKPFDRAVALLHSFWFGAAVEAFTAVAKTDPQCAMAYWGLALSRWSNPFGGFRSPQALAAGRDAVAQAQAASTATPRERAYVAAVAELYRDYETVDQPTRVLAYERRMDALRREYPDDPEAAIFYALALTQTAPPTDKSYRNLLAAGAILEPLFEAQPDHPGIAHYIIHCYDVPALAPKALGAATRYAAIAPSAPHALHMPSHTFTRVGHWEDSIATNIASADAARRDKAIPEVLHALDYQAYAYLQTAQDEAVRRLLGQLPSLAPQIAGGTLAGAPPTAGFFALAAIPARYALERNAWDEAAALAPLETAYLFPDSVTHFARALGAARAGRADAARADLARLEALARALHAKNDAYWAEQVEIQHDVASAWVAYAGGRRAEALAAMREAADREDRSEKSAISPGPLVPARELLGDMLLESGQPAEALAAYEASMAKEPNRFRGLAGAARAAAAAGRPDVAERYRARLVELCPKGDTQGRPELAQARQSARRE